MIKSITKAICGLVICLAAVGTYYLADVYAQSRSVGVVSVEFAEAYTSPCLTASLAAFLQEGEIIDIENYEDGWLNFNLDGNSVYIPIASVAILQAEGLIITGSAFLLYEPTPLSEVFSAIPMGTVVNIIGYFGDYFAVDAGGRTVYVHGRDMIGGLLCYLQEYGPTPFYFSQRRENGTKVSSATDFLTVVGSVYGLNMRTRPDASSESLKRIPNGNVLEVVELGREWHRVTFLGESGYVSARFTELNGGVYNGMNNGLRQAQSGLADQLIQNAKRYLGARYSWGGTSASTGFDCSGFTYTVFRSVGITLNRVSRDQVRNGTAVSRSELLPGDLVFFATGRGNGGSGITHVGLYIGGGDFIHSSSSGRRGVIISSLNDAYYTRTFRSAARVLN